MMTHPLHPFYYCGGVGILINSKWKSQIREINSISERVIYITIELTAKIHIKIIQVYAPTQSYNDEVVEELYEDVTRALTEAPVKYSFIMGDFNAKLGKKETYHEKALGNYGVGTRNDRGNTLLNFLNQNNLFAMNTFFEKKLNRKWTWKSPDGATKNEIDFIISNCKRIIQDVSVLNNFTTGSDHRLIRARVKINVKAERQKLVTGHRRDMETHIKNIRENNETYIKKIEDLLHNKDFGVMSINDINKNLQIAMNAALKEISPNTQAKHKKITRETIELIEKRRQLRQNNKADTQEYSELQKQIRKKCREDIRQYNMLQIEKTIADNSSRKVLKSKLSTGKREIFKLCDKDGEITNNRTEILKISRNFYEDLYKSRIERPDQEIINKTHRNAPIMNVGSEDLPDVIISEIQHALQQLKNRRSPGEDGIIPEMIKACDGKVHEILTTLFNKCLHEADVPDDWNNAVIILLHKKGDIKKLENYRPISLLSHLYKLFTRVILNRLTNKLDSYQPPEQAGFRSGYSTSDHLQTLKTLIEKCHEYNKPIVLTFVDYEKAFDTIETWAVINALKDCRIDERYIRLFKNIQNKATSCIRLHTNTETFKIERGVRQGDTISPKLFTLTLENIFRELMWENKGINIDGQKLNNLRFADDIVLISETLDEMLEMIQQLQEKSLEVGLKMNSNKTKIMTTLDTENIQLPVEKVTDYIYLGHKITLGRENQTSEIERRITQAWVAFGKLNTTFRSQIPNSLKKKVFDQCVLPVFTYGAETLTLTKQSVNKLRVAQRKMERIMLGINLRDRKKNQWIRGQTKVNDVIDTIASMKWSWAGHVARMENDRWTKRLIQWRPRANKRLQGRPPTRWVDDIRRFTGRNWIREAQERATWNSLREAYVLQWANMG